MTTDITTQLSRLALLIVSVSVPFWVLAGGGTGANNAKSPSAKGVPKRDHVHRSQSLPSSLHRAQISRSDAVVPRHSGVRTADSLAPLENELAKHPPIMTQPPDQIPQAPTEHIIDIHSTKWSVPQHINQCTICVDDVSCVPICTACAYQICESCFDGSNSAKLEQCPQCYGTLEDRDISIRTKRGHTQTLNNSYFRCQGCGWQKTYPYVKDHIKLCQSRKATGSQGECSQRFEENGHRTDLLAAVERASLREKKQKRSPDLTTRIRSQLPSAALIGPLVSHPSGATAMVARCHYRCGFAAASPEELEAHFLVCPKKLGLCRHCRRWTPQNDLLKHESTCDLRAIRCDTCGKYYPPTASSREAECWYKEPIILIDPEQGPITLVPQPEANCPVYQQENRDSSMIYLAIRAAQFREGTTPRSSVALFKEDAHFTFCDRKSSVKLSIPAERRWAPTLRFYLAQTDGYNIEYMGSVNSTTQGVLAKVDLLTTKADSVLPFESFWPRGTFLYYRHLPGEAWLDRDQHNLDQFLQGHSDQDIVLIRVSTVAPRVWKE